MIEGRAIWVCSLEIAVEMFTGRREKRLSAPERTECENEGKTQKPSPSKTRHCMHEHEPSERHRIIESLLRSHLLELMDNAKPDDHCLPLVCFVVFCQEMMDYLIFCIAL